MLLFRNSTSKLLSLYRIHIPKGRIEWERDKKREKQSFPKDIASWNLITLNKWRKCFWYKIQIKLGFLEVVIPLHVDEAGLEKVTVM